MQTRPATKPIHEAIITQSDRGLLWFPRPQRDENHGTTESAGSLHVLKHSVEKAKAMNRPEPGPEETAAYAAIRPPNVQPPRHSSPSPHGEGVGRRPGDCSLSNSFFPAPANDEPAKQSLKKTFLECLGAVSTRADTLRQAIAGLLDLHVPWQQLWQWAKDAGHKDKSVRKLLSEILLELGIRRRTRGAGPKLPQEAILIEAGVRAEYGERTQKFLRAACRVAKAKDESETPATKGLSRYRIRPITDPSIEPQVVKVRTRSTASLTERQTDRSPISHILTYEN